VKKTQSALCPKARKKKSMMNSLIKNLGWGKLRESGGVSLMALVPLIGTRTSKVKMLFYSHC